VSFNLPGWSALVSRSALSCNLSACVAFCPSVYQLTRLSSNLLVRLSYCPCDRNPVCLSIAIRLSVQQSSRQSNDLLFYQGTCLLSSSFAACLAICPVYESCPPAYRQEDSFQYSISIFNNNMLFSNLTSSSLLVFLAICPSVLQFSLLISNLIFCLKYSAHLSDKVRVVK
jgi:hypothetical protein